MGTSQSKLPTSLPCEVIDKCISRPIKMLHCTSYIVDEEGGEGSESAREIFTVKGRQQCTVHIDFVPLSASPAQAVLPICGAAKS